MKTREANEEKRIESKMEVSTYLDRLKYAFKTGQANLEFQQQRLVDQNRSERFTNNFTVGDLFPDEDPVLALKRELGTLSAENYIETVKDKRFQKRSEMRVFGKRYSDDVYIKIRVELMKGSMAGTENFVFVMSFHYAEHAFIDSDFPYAKR